MQLNCHKNIQTNQSASCLVGHPASFIEVGPPTRKMAKLSQPNSNTKRSWGDHIIERNPPPHTNSTSAGACAVRVGARPSYWGQSRRRGLTEKSPTPRLTTLDNFPGFKDKTGELTCRRNLMLRLI